MHERYLELFKDGHSPTLAMYSYEDELHLSTKNDQELLELLADRGNNPDYGYIFRLFQEFHKNILGDHNGKKMFERLAQVVEDYNSSGNGQAVLQEYDAQIRKAFILYIMTGMMCRIHEQILQAGELCYVDTSALFEPLNTSITLLYMSCAIGALPFRLLITLDESEVTLKKVVII